MLFLMCLACVVVEWNGITKWTYKLAKHFSTIPNFICAALFLMKALYGILWYLKIKEGNKMELTKILFKHRLCFDGLILSYSLIMVLLRKLKLRCFWFYFAIITVQELVLYFNSVRRAIRKMQQKELL